MSNPLVPLTQVVASARGAWGDGDESPGHLSDAALVALFEELVSAERLIDAAKASAANEIARRSAPDLGSDGLAKKQGFRSPTALIAATGGSSTGDAKRLLKVGEATAPRSGFDGPKPARHPHVATALRAGKLGRDAAAAIVEMLDRVGPQAEPDALDAAEASLVERAPGLSEEQLARLILRTEARLDPKGVARREAERRAKQVMNIYEQRDGMTRITALLDPESAAPLTAAITAMVTAELRAKRENPEPDAEQRTIPQMQADALVRLAEHALGCDETDLPLAGATVIVRVDLADLESGEGSAAIDGVTAPVTVETARRMAAGGGVIPLVLGSKGEPLDCGREQRFFTRAQKLVLVERDGGCAMCGAPPGHTKAHHIKWWTRDTGPTDLSNGVLLCTSCHHRIHDNGWEIQVDGVRRDSAVWFIPPPDVDPARTPRLGGRARFDAAA